MRKLIWGVNNGNLSSAVVAEWQVGRERLSQGRGGIGKRSCGNGVWKRADRDGQQLQNSRTGYEFERHKGQFDRILYTVVTENLAENIRFRLLLIPRSLRRAANAAATISFDEGVSFCLGPFAHFRCIESGRQCFLLE